MRAVPRAVNTCQACSKRFEWVPHPSRRKRTFCSRECSRKDGMSLTPRGPASPIWKGGVHSNSYRKIAFDAYPALCVCCGTTRQLMVHHINENRKDNRVANLQILCRSCHGYHHGIYEKGKPRKRKTPRD